ncbi:MAG: hypothetical protein JO197_23935 [Acidobacteria bacterium]|nr:hypothetical protein [Acidobacteriota bacterium]MBV9474963.1 hypothetical protein [Acidobacteriota bacterium]
MKKAIAVFAFLVLPLAAQPAAADKGAAEFDPSVTSLPAGFKPADFQAVYRVLSIPPKDEYETTAQWEARKNKVPHGVYAFNAAPIGPVNYDADTGKFTINLYFDFVHRGRESADGGLLVLQRTGKVDGTHQASNAFGATVTVQSSTWHEWGLILPDQDFGIVALKVAVPVENARAVKDRLGVLAVATLGPESVPQRMTAETRADLHDVTGFNWKDATIDSPTEQETFQYAIDAQLLGLWVYDTQTGEVYGKYDVEGHPLDRSGNEGRRPLRPLSPEPTAVASLSRDYR